MGVQFQLFVVCSALVADVSSMTAQLPFNIGDTHAARKNAEQQGKWWARIDDHTYYEPTSLLGLSSNISHYFCALGSDSALSDDMKMHRVGGHGRWHIFHLPEGPPPSLLHVLGNAGDRQKVFSSLLQMTHGHTLSNTFPVYHPSDSYVNPLNTDHQRHAERVAVELVTADVVSKYLNSITSLYSRSYNSAEATLRAEQVVQAHFQSMGMKTCLHNFDTSRKLANVIAIVPGRSTGSVIVGAHYDSRPWKGPAPGANDNGSGVASLLALANAFMEADIHPEKTIYFVAFAAEEAGMLGSVAFVNAFRSSSANGIPKECRLPGQSFLQIRSSAASHKAIIMDEVGWITRNSNYPKPTVNLESTDVAADVLQHLVHAGREYNGDAVEIVHNDAPFGSDHMSFLNEGLHAVLTINGDDESYPNYHQSSDTVENVSPGFVAQISKMNMGALLRLSGIQS